ncbi:MAG: hypothetical protein GC185_00730 [Alphaproteobacteria bacterium]|nr:hypothetical protein [Alphaproteobacteria bacterium]
MTSDETDAEKGDLASVAERLKQVTDYVMDCERRVTRGEIMELQGLDGSVLEICNAVAALPKSEAETMEAQMGRLIDGLESLAEAIRAQEDATGGETGK